MYAIPVIIAAAIIVLLSTGIWFANAAERKQRRQDVEEAEQDYRNMVQKARLLNAKAYLLNK